MSLARSHSILVGLLTAEDTDTDPKKTIFNFPQVRYRSKLFTCADVLFVVGREIDRKKELGPILIAAHSEVLATNSSIFRDQITCHGPIVYEKEASPSAFNKLVNFLYNQSIQFDISDIIDTIRQARRYKIEDLCDGAVQFLKQHIDTQNCIPLLAEAKQMTDIEELCASEVWKLAAFIASNVDIGQFWKFYALIKQYDLTFMQPFCAEFIDGHIQSVLQHPASVHELTPKGLRKMISRESFTACPLETFMFVKKWLDIHSETSSEHIQQILKQVPLPLLTIMEICEFVRPTGLYTDSQIVDALAERESRTMQTRKLRLDYQQKVEATKVRSLSNVNFASEEFGAKLVSGNINRGCNLFSTLPQFHYQTREIYVYHNFAPFDPRGITIELQAPTKLNCVQILIWDGIFTPCVFEYYIELSTDGVEWCRVSHRTNGEFESWQTHNFSTHVAKYVRVVGISEQSGQDKFCISSVRCFFKPLDAESQFFCDLKPHS